MHYKYISKRGYHYEQHNDGSITRIAGGGRRSRKKQSRKKQSNDPLMVGMRVTINKKPYVPPNLETGKIAKILTKKVSHPRGRKVKLDSGSIGRIFPPQKI